MTDKQRWTLKDRWNYGWTPPRTIDERRNGKPAWPVIILVLIVLIIGWLAT